MPLVDIELTSSVANLPEQVTAFLVEADRRVNQIRDRPANVCHGFVPSNFPLLYQALDEVVQRNLAVGRRFCEWGSGLGVVSALAAMLGFDAIGIEIEPELVTGAEALAHDFSIPVEFAEGSFVPHAAESIFDRAYRDCDGSLSLSADADGTYEALGLDVDDFDLIFSYPWPNDEELTATLFERFAANGALLLTYHQPEAIRLRRKQTRNQGVKRRR